MEYLPGILDEVFPSRGRRRQELRQDIRSLWESLTSEREHRTAEYLSAPAFASAYIRYFLPWNMLRLGHLLPSLPLSLPPNPILADIGSGPLTLPISLYISRPELRTQKLTFYCADKTERILKLGRLIFESLCVRLSGALPPWEIILLHESFGSNLPRRVDLLTSANLFNEFFWKGKDSLEERAVAAASSIARQISDRGQVFFMEPGDPRSGSFIAAMRTALFDQGFHPLAPCPHEKPCPMPGLAKGYIHGPDRGPESASLFLPKPREKYPWCHFTLHNPKAPSWLTALSDEIGLPKEKLVFSYLLTSKVQPAEAAAPAGAAAPGPLLRIVSESFTLPGHFRGRYACSSEGYCLARYPGQQMGSDPTLNAASVTSGATMGSDPFLSGDLTRMPPTPDVTRRAARRNSENYDEKSGAFIVHF
jgi:hypothetical protein